MPREISNQDDIIDSRDVIERIKELEQIACDGTVDCPYHGDDNCEMGDAGEADELEALKALAEEASESPDWEYGEALIRDSYFQEHAEQFADDIGAIDRNAAWPTMYIDWKAAANALKQDYLSVDFDGVTYWVRV